MRAAHTGGPHPCIVSTAKLPPGGVGNVCGTHLCNIRYRSTGGWRRIAYRRDALMREERTMEARPAEDQGAGIVLFAALMLMLAGLIGVAEWIVALASSLFYTQNATYVFSDVRTWGWIQLVIGLAQLAAAFAIFGGRQWGRWLGIGVAILSVLGQLFFSNAQPWWALIVIAIDIITIYALARYGVAAFE
jgi:hypothetical protein